ncbi:hypothetical protein CLAFUW4_09681 [Fulvia fulva]|uniref:Uncharacterized protein n=1 Tax=Passalora fulva TaxID=5499 RepID=A0A9Q8PGQ2_PASFU|nr:uncharacterized protein CLAFUR5_09775 [Fulvia fulva]KAK4614050.1 hypothetical protein CLAFUR4_09686 [Fulvia fulva]KAK4615195.1 hypothetical protein CLAFUR0_09677 [Fulvia fulva]UJO22099.1 hypothetical protein CLAFUR5_09775 [Fulvia fulva]WPV20446.1 hypothetical protein CLAFUW4_09681 [Fulvia fulva]WPV34874.1 hypothetical protein CLAFUW7_09682 [Fulvia fulva]
MNAAGIPSHESWSVDLVTPIQTTIEQVATTSLAATITAVTSSPVSTTNFLDEITSLWNEPAAATPTGTATSCPWPGCWYDEMWAGPLTWMIVCYCIVSASILVTLLCGGYLDWKLNLSDPYRRNSYRRQPRSTNDFLEYHSHVYQQRQRERAAARSNPPTRNLEQSQRFYEAAGMRSSTQELRQQLQSQLASRSEPDLRYVHPDVLDELRASERERRDAIVIANLRRQGLM